jgi:hypothetical protein
MSAGLAVWLGLVAVSFTVTAVDVLRHPNRDMPIMNAVWPLMALYFGPLGVLSYVLLSRRVRYTYVRARPVLPSRVTPVPGHAHGGIHALGRMRDPLWVRSMRSTTHCMAGCALGDLTAMVLAAFGWLGAVGMGKELFLGAVFAFAFGLFVFQALPVMAERRIGFAQSLGIAFQADLYTIVAYLVGQIPAFYILTAGAAMSGMGLVGSHLVDMQASMAVGFLTSYPVNYVLVAKGVKHGM